jgi:hypothetical protein
MTFVSLADASGHLGIDPKTLRRWLAHAQLPLQPYPSDGRKHGLSEEHVRLLARLHQRALPTLPQDVPPAASVAATLPSHLLALPELLGALHAQLEALQEQITALTHTLQQHSHQPAVPVSAARPSKRVPKPASPAPRSRPAASAVTKPAHVLPLVEWGSSGHYVVICPKQGLLALELDSPSWFAWLATQSSFRFVGRHGRFTAHHEVERVPNGAWRAHRHIRNHSYTLRLGRTHELTMAVLEQAAATLQVHLK